MNDAFEEPLTNAGLLGVKVFAPIQEGHAESFALVLFAIAGFEQLGNRRVML